MPIRPLVVLPDPRLRLKSEPVGAVSDDIRTLAQDMLDTMYDAPGVGLAAIQIGVPKRVITMDVSKSETERNPLVLINPEVVWASEDQRISGLMNTWGCFGSSLRAMSAVMIRFGTAT